MMNFVKMHGAGNDFVVMEAAGDEHDWPRLAMAMCDRHFGVGADGLLLALRSSHAEIRMRVFNSDGSEAEMCGNGIRCLAKYAVEKGLVKPADGRFSIETMASVVSVEVSGEGGKVDRVRVGMGVPGLTPEEIPVLVHRETPLVNLPLEVGRGSTAGDSTRDILPVTCVSMGNPHAVQFVNQPVADFSLEEVGPRVAEHPQFPRGVNFEVARVIDRSHIEARVWERGAGLTLACGSGACAVMVAARLQGLVDDAVDITLPGGTLTLEWDGKGIVYLTGPAVTVFTGEWLLGG
jgi:diaminopimelate epimerase